MGPTHIDVSRQYQIAKKALAPDGIQKQAALGDVQPAESKLAQGISEFSKVFETVEAATQSLAQGKGDPHSVVQAMANAEVALETAVTIRNRVVEAYQEFLRMPV